MHIFERFLLSVSLFIVGSLLIMAALALIAWVTSLLESLEPPLTEEQAASGDSGSGVTAVSGELVEPSAASSPVIDPTTVAVITASVLAVLAGRRFRINKIQLAIGDPSPWGQSGRQAIHTSHVIERKKVS